MAESFLPPVIVELGANDTGAAKAIRSLATALTRIPEPAQAAADAFKIVQDAATQMGDGIVAPLDAAKASIRGLASALRALAKTALTTDDEGKTALDGIAQAARTMAAAVAQSASEAQAAMAGLGGEFKAAAGESTAAATAITASADESAAAATASGDAAAASATKSGAALEGTAGALQKYAMGLAAAGFGVFEAIKGASKFNSEITKLNTQAGVSKSQLSSLGDGVLQLAGQVGQSPDSLAEALFHVESNFASLGIKGPDALNLVKIAAEGAKVGGANLVDVTNTLTAAVASGIPGVQNMGQAMGALNAIVGAGDMKMQDLAEAFGSGMVATVKGFGLSLTDVGAALAVFGDNNIRGAKAGTDLRVAVQSLASPVKSAKGELQKLGLTQDTLAQDMRTGGLLKALEDLQGRFKATGVTATEQGQVITTLFGKKAGSGLNVLLDQMDRLKSKYPDITKGAGQFGSAWQTTSHTISTEFDGLKSGLEALGIKIGDVLLPPLTTVLGWIRDGVTWVTEHKAAIQGLAAVVGGALVAGLWAVVGALTAIEVDPVILGITAVVAALIFAYEHFKTFRTIVQDVGKFLAGAFTAAWHAAADVIHWFTTNVLPTLQSAIQAVFTWFDQHKQDFANAWTALAKSVQAAAKWIDDNVLKWLQARIADLAAWWHAHSAQIQEVWRVTFKTMALIAKVWWDGVMKPFLAILAAAWKVAWGLIVDGAKLAWALISGVTTAGMHWVLNIIGVILDMITGHWGRAWHDMVHTGSQAFHDVVNAIGSVTNSFGTLLYDAGKNIIIGLINGMYSMIGSVGSVAGDIASYVRSFFPFSPAKRGPLSGSGSPDLAGAKIGAMLADGMHGSLPAVGTASARLASAAALAVGGAAGGQLSALAVGGAGVGGTSAPQQMAQVQVIVQLDRKVLFEALQTEALRYGRRNPTTGLIY